jgi:hypothetical protein
MAEVQNEKKSREGRRSIAKMARRNGTNKDILAGGGNPRWFLAIEAIISGQTDTEAAKIAGVAHSTVNRWRNSNPVFQAELNSRRNELRSALNDKLFGFVEQITAAITKALNSPDVSPAVLLQVGLNTLPKLYALVAEQHIGCTDAVEMIKKKREAEARNEWFQQASDITAQEISRIQNAALDELNAGELDEAS